MKRNHKISIFLSIIGTLCLASGLVLSNINNTSSMTNIKTILKTSMTGLKQGERIDITLDLGDYTNIQSGYNAYKATIEYDKRIFEEITEESFTCLNDWEKLKYNRETGEFVSIKRAGSKTKEDIVKITLQVKQNAPSTSTVINIGSIVASEGKEDININAKNVKIDIKSQTNIVPDGNTPPLNTTTEVTNTKPNTKKVINNSNKQNSQNESTSQKEDPNKQENTIEQEEKEDDKEIISNENEKQENNEKENSKNSSSIIYIFIIIILLLILLLFYRRKNKNKPLKNTLMIILAGFLYLQFTMGVYALCDNFIFKGELNGDSKIDYEDLNLLQLHLINKEYLEEKYLENADMNNDGNITVTDLTLLIRKIEKTLIYKVELTNVEQPNKYINKNTDFDLLFKAQVNYGQKIEKVKVNDTYYDIVEVNKETEEYKIKVNSSNTIGTKKYNFTEAILDNKEKVKINFEESVEILKNKPELKNYNMKENLETALISISFEIKDEDNALTSSSIQIVDESGKVIKTSQIIKGKNTINLIAEEDKIYRATLKLNYNLTTNKDLIDENLVETTQIDKELKLVGDYKLNIDNIKTYNNTTETSTFTKNENIKIAFNCTNITKFIPEKVTISGKNYPVNIENNQYITIIPGLGKLGSNTIKLEKITLSNGKVIEVKENNKITVNIIKNTPTIKNLTLEENTKESEVNVSFDINNEENLLIKMLINLMDDKDTLLGQIKLDKEELKDAKSIKKKFKNINAITSKYKINIVADYSQTENEEEINKNVVLIQKEFQSITKVQITKINSDKRYYEKGENAVLTFGVNTNKKENITKIHINSKEYSVIKVADSLYQVVYKNEQTSGLKELKIEKIIYSDKEEINVNTTLTLETLKTKPSIENYNIDRNIEESKIIIGFDIIDKDKAITDSKIEVLDETGAKIVQQEIKTGTNKIEVKVQEKKLYKAKFLLNYNLSSDKNIIDTTGKIVGSITEEKEIPVLTGYDFKINNFEIYNGKNLSTLFEKGQDIKIVFDSTNNTKYIPNKITINGNSYNLEQENDKFTVTIKGFNNFGNNNIKIESVTLNNGKKFDLTENNILTITTIKKVPTIKELEIKEEKEINISFKIEDKDKALSKLVVNLYDDNNKLVEQVELTKEEINSLNTITKKFKKVSTSKYTASVVGSYLLTTEEKDTKKDIVLATKELTAKTEAQIIEANTNKIYYEKNEDIILTYKINTNKKENIAKIYINDKDYIATKIEDGFYQVTYTGEKTSGIKNLKATKIIYSDQTVVNVTNTLTVEVLKNIPTITGFSTKESPQTSQVTIDFTLNDEDNSFINGEAILQNKETGSSVKRTIKKGKNSLDFDVKDLNAYILNINATYDRDTNTLTTTDNEMKNHTLLTKEIKPVFNYELKIKNIRTSNNSQNTNYFNKNEKINVDFECTNQANLEPIKVTINGKEYSIIKIDNSYRATINGLSSAGINSLTINKITLANNKKLDITKENEVQVDILKDKPTAKEFSYNKKENKINIKFTLKDTDKALVTGKVQVLSGNNTIATKTLNSGENTLEVQLNNALSEYFVIVMADYDLDSNNKDNNNLYKNQELLKEKINVSTDVIELKDITNTELYYNNTKIDALNIEKGLPKDLEKYYVKIDMKSLPTYYANVKRVEKDKNTGLINITINQTDFISYTYNKEGYTKTNSYTFNIPYTDKDGYHPLIESAESLFAEMRKNPKSKFILEQDIDASEIATNSTAIGDFSGTLDGNGHKILNLKTALFSNLNNATIKNLVIENAKITNNSKGILANNINSGTTIQNTHLINSSINNNQNQVGSFAGNITKASIKESAVIEINIKANNTIGGIVGQMSGGSQVENCYVTGKLEGTINHNLGARIGGITGWDSGTKIEKCYTNVTIKAPNKTGNGGLIGGPNGVSPVIKDSVSIGGGTAYRIAGFNTTSKMTNVYEYSKSNSATNIINSTSQIKSIESIYNKDFYKNTLSFDEKIWNLNLVNNNHLPTLKNDPTPNTLDDYEIEENKNDIPNYKEIRKDKNYNANKEILYYNMSKLMPFADTKSWLENANNYTENSKLASQKIKFILPLTEENNLVLGIQKIDSNKIKKIRIIYENQDSDILNVEYTKTIEELIAIYQIKDSSLRYQFDNYISKIDENILNNIVSKATSYDYASKIAKITSEEESRLYVDFYNENVKNNLKNVLLNYLLTEENIPTYNNNKLLKNKIEEKLSEENLIHLLYAYNYYEKWYHLDLDGIKMSDLLFFNGNRIHNDLDTNYMINSIINTNSSNRATNNTVSFYNSAMQAKTHMSLPDFLAYLFKTVNGYNDPSDWVKDHFKGILYEQEATGSHSKEIIYRIWPIMKRSHTHVILPILSAPNEDMYMISCPSQFIIGSMNRYPTYLNKDGKERERMYNTIKSYAGYLGTFYGTAAGFIPNAISILNNNRVNAQYDTRFYFPASPKADAGTQEAGKTKDPVMKWVYEAIGGAWAAANGSGAYANGYNVWWVADAALGNPNRSIHVFTHETAHNQDGSYFYAGNGRRSQTGAESHADGVIAQDIGSTAEIFNLVYNFDLTSDISTNLTYERINTAEKISDYYKKMYETKYVLEYLAGKAFLKLTPEEQAKVAVKVNHNTNSANYSTTYTRLTKEDFEKMNLKTMEDLWDNQIALRGAGSSPHTWNGRYGYDSFYQFDFYIPNNPNGAPDVNTFKNTGYEMLGYAGYDKGFITYMSGRSANDLVALRNITGDNTMTWKKYKLSRYQTVKENLNKIKCFDIEELTTLYENALKQDAKNGNLNTSVAVSQLHYGIMKRTTNDFRTGDIYNNPSPISITSAQQLIDLVNKNAYGSYRIDKDLDFTNIAVEEGKSYYIDNRFLGILDGNGHKLTGMKYTLFNNMVYASVKNLTIEEPTYKPNVTAYLSLNSKNVVVGNNNVINSNVSIPNIKSKTGKIFTLGTNNLTVRTNQINTAEEFLNMVNSDIGRKSKFILNADIDFSNITINANAVVTGTFTGNIEGNGHKIKNLKTTLFNSLNGAKISNLSIENANITNNSKGFLANTITNNSTIQKVYIKNSKLSNNQGQVGSFTGEISNSTIKESAAIEVSIKANNTIGGIAGQMSSGSIVENCFVTGKVEGTISHNLGARIGGITGWDSGTRIEKCYTNISIKARTRTGNGGLIGGPNGGSPIVTNSVSLSSGDAYRIAGFGTISAMVKVYESASSNSTTNIINGQSQIKLIENLNDKSFYKNTLEFDEKIWNLDSVTTKGYPELR